MPTDRLRGRWLQGLFALALGWALLWLGVWVLGEQFEVPNPVPEGTRLHDVFEDYLPPLVAIVLAGAITALGIRAWPSFLRIPDQSASWRLLVSLALAAPVAAIGLLIIVIAVCVALEPLPWKSDNPQYIPAVFWYAPLLTMALTPVATVVVAWWWAVRRRTEEREA